MARIATSVTNRVLELLSAEQGVAPALAEMSLDAGIVEGPITALHLVPRNVSSEIAEKSTGVVYPAFYLYCERFTNTLREKFRTFSGTARMMIEIRASQDRLDQIEQRLQVYVDSVTAVLDANRGDWGQGIFYTGGYDITFSPVRHGGRNFLQIAKVSFEVQVSRD